MRDLEGRVHRQPFREIGASTVKEEVIQMCSYISRVSTKDRTWTEK